MSKAPAWPGAAALVGAAAVTLAAAAYIWQAEDRARAAGFVATLVGLATTAAALFRWLWRTRRRPGAATTDDLVRAADELAAAVATQWRREAQVRGLTAPAPVAVRWVWTPRPVAVDVADAVAPVSVGVGPGPVPGVRVTEATDVLTEGVIERLHEIYAGVSIGRLVILGAAGTGKTAAAILLLLHALAYRGSRTESERDDVPVPVLLTLSEWDPAREPLVEWAGVRMLRDYPMLRTFPSGSQLPVELISRGHVALFLDGLDEMAPDRRGRALRLVESATATRIVLLTRPEEYEAAVPESLPPAVVLELLQVDADTAASYLVHGHRPAERDSWGRLASHIRSHPQGPVAGALSTPLMLSLARASYPAGTDPNELQAVGRFPTAAAVEDHLLDRLLDSAYAEDSGHQASYTPDQARRWLGYLAHQMQRDGTRDLSWWRVPDWVCRWTIGAGLGVVMGLLIGASVLARSPLLPGPIQFVVLLALSPFAITGMSLGLVFGMGGFGTSLTSFFTHRAEYSEGRRSLLLRDLRAVFILVILPTLPFLPALVVQPQTSDALSLLWVILLVGTLPALLAALAFRLAGFTAGVPVDIRFARPSRQDLFPGMVVGTSVGLLAAVVDLWWFSSPVSGASGVQELLVQPSVFVLVGLLAGGLVAVFAGFVRAGSRAAAGNTPAALWRCDVEGALAAGVVFALGSWLIFVVFSGGADRVMVKFLAWWVLVWLIVGLAATQAARLWVAGLVMRLRGNGPLRVLRFLEDARSRQLLRQAGSVYQFRHARLQDRLAEKYNQAHT